MKYTLDDFARLIDHTNLHADATEADMKKLCDEAKKYHFKMVAINQVQSKFVQNNWRERTLILVPGAPTRTADYWIQGFWYKGCNQERCQWDWLCDQYYWAEGQEYDYIKREVQEMVDVCRTSYSMQSNFENCYLTKDEIKKLAEIAKEVKPDFIKTSTGFGTSGAKVEC